MGTRGGSSAFLWPSVNFTMLLYSLTYQKIAHLFDLLVFCCSRFTANQRHLANTSVAKHARQDLSDRGEIRVITSHCGELLTCLEANCEVVSFTVTLFISIPQVLPFLENKYLLSLYASLCFVTRL